MMKGIADRVAAAQPEGVAVDKKGNIFVSETVPGKTDGGLVTGHVRSPGQLLEFRWSRSGSACTRTLRG